MSTFLVSFGVVAATIAAVVYVALGGPDQPATIRRPATSARPGGTRSRKRADRKADDRRTRATTAPAPPLPPPPSPPPRATAPAMGAASGSAMALADSDPMRIRVLPAAPTTLWVRIRSGVALVVLVGVLGALLALAVGGILVAIAFLVRSATG